MYWQVLECTKIMHILIKHQIIGCFRYIDHILYLWRLKHWQHHVRKIKCLSKIKIQRSGGGGGGYKINFLDITLMKQKNIFKPKYWENQQQITSSQMIHVTQQRTGCQQLGIFLTE